MKNVSETSHATFQGHVSTSLNMLRLVVTTLCSTNITAVWIEMNLIIIIGKVNYFISSGIFFCLQMEN